MMVKRLDIVKLGVTAQERHTVVAHPVAGRVYVKQHTTGKVREVAVERCVVIGHADDYQQASMVRGSGNPVRCPKCGGPDPFHDPACVVHPDLIQDHTDGSK